MSIYVATERLCKTEDGRLVAEDHVDARWLYCTPGDEIPVDEAIAAGLVKADPAPAATTAADPSAKAPEKPARARKPAGRGSPIEES